MNKLKGLKAIVTGGAMGIGLDTTRRLLKEGVEVAIWDLNQAAMNEAKEELKSLGGTVHMFKCDVADKEMVLKTVKATKKKMGQVDILINNAGFVRPGWFLDQPVDEAVKTTDINLNSIYYTTHALLPDMIERDKGFIVNVSSAAGLIGVAKVAAYSAAKFGVLGFTEALRFELEKKKIFGVKLSTVHPYFIKTGMFEGAKVSGLAVLVARPLKNHDIIAKAIVERLLKRNANIVKRPITSHILPLGRGIFPNKFGLFFVKLLGVSDAMDTWSGKDGH